jgi:glycolate oxidase
MQFDRLRTQLDSPESLITEVGAHESYFHDATYFTNRPAGILLAESVSDIVKAVNFCRENRIPITPRGAGTGLSGGCVATSGALVLSTERMKSLGIDSATRTAVCGPGVITKVLQDAAANYGLTYPPDPASYEESSLGGNVAEGAGGLRCKRFGVTKDYVLGLETVLADGTMLRTGMFNNNRGFALGDLLIGSEGTLGVITKIALRLTPQPGLGLTILAAFGDPRDAAQTVADINAAGIVPTVMEFCDGDAAACSNEYERTDGLDTAAGILLFETLDVDASAQTEQLKAFCRRNSCTYLQTESDPAKAVSLWRIRRNLSKAVKAAAVYRISEDVAVPNSQFPTLVAYVAEMNRNSRFRINSYGHAGDGNLHVNFMADANSPENLQELEQWVERLMKRTIELGGTLTGEHGIGLAKKAYLAMEFDTATLRAMRAVKSVLDPLGVFNPDKIFTDGV